MTLDEFEKMVNNHDLTYSYSDDGSVYRKGLAQEREIMKAAKLFPSDDVKRIWNAMVDKKLVESTREQFYWRINDQTP